MREFNEANATDVVLARLENCADPRLKEVIAAATRHLHAFVREIRPTQAEWETAIQFLTETGQKCDPTRQEFILFSDIMGVSMLVDAVVHPTAGGMTETTVLGPFHVAGSPTLPHGTNIARHGHGEDCVVSGRVVDQDGQPIAGAVLDVWQASEDGWYDLQQPDAQPPGNLRGKFETDADGRFWFVSVKPSSYPIPTDGPVGALLRDLGRHPYRPAHIHFIVSAAGAAPLTTHIFVEGDPYIDSDTVFGVKPALIAPFTRHESPEEAARVGVRAPFWSVSYEFHLRRAALAIAAD